MAALCRSGTQQLTMILIGHEGVRELGAVAMGNMWVSCTGMMFVFGGMSALDTLAAQAYGAGNYVRPQLPHFTSFSCHFLLTFSVTFAVFFFIFMG